MCWLFYRIYFFIIIDLYNSFLAQNLTQIFLYLCMPQQSVHFKLVNCFKKISIELKIKSFYETPNSFYCEFIKRSINPSRIKARVFKWKRFQVSCQNSPRNIRRLFSNLHKVLNHSSRFIMQKSHKVYIYQVIWTPPEQVMMTDLWKILNHRQQLHF